jgi:retinol-binding protein 3
MSTRFRQVIVFVFLALFAALSPARSQEVAIPETPAGRVLAAWLEAFNSGVAEKVSAFQKQYELKPALSVDDVLSFRTRTGGFDLVAIHKSKPHQLEFSLKERLSDTRALAIFEVTEAEAPRLLNSMIRVMPPGAEYLGVGIDADTRARVIEGAIAKLDENYVFPETAKKMAQSLRRRQKRGEYDAVTDGFKFAALLTTHLREISHDKHLSLNFFPGKLPGSPAAPSAEQLAANRKAMERNNCGFEKLERLAGNVGYVKFNMFADPEACGATATAAMNFLGNSDALIFDLRENFGGDPRMIALISTYLFAGPTHLNDIWERKTGVSQQYWTLPFVAGKRLPNVPVFVLTSSRTFSGAEEFTYNLKNLGRATIVGETTGGGAHPVRGERIDDRFSIGVPFARAINPISKTNWEGTGVEPDVKTSAAEALAVAQKLAGEKLAPKPGP